MFEYFRKSLFLAGIQAELKAQYGNQHFVNCVCQSEAAYSAIFGEMYSNRKLLPTPKSMRYFVSVCEVLSQRLALQDVSHDDQIVCAKLLQDRYKKLASNPVMSACLSSQMAEWRANLKDFGDRLERDDAGVAQG